MTFNEYSIAGRAIGTKDLVFSLIATTFGASAVFGTISYIFASGSAYIWFLWISSIAFFIKGMWFAKPLYETNGYTLPEAFGIVVHPSLRIASAGLIAVSWLGVIAAQLIAAGTLLEAFFPSIPYEIFLFIFTMIVAAYTAIGGQKAVFVTDKIQLLIMLGCFVIIIMFLMKITPVSPSFIDAKGLIGSAPLMITWFISKGLSIIVGPDMYTRIRSAKNAETAQKASFIAGFFHIFVSTLVLILGLFLKQNALPQEDALGVMSRLFPIEFLLIAGIGFLCAIASSCDTTLINASLIIENDIIKGKKPKRVAVIVWIMAILSLGIALHTPDILKLILSAYALYVPVAVPLFIVGLLFSKKRTFNKKLALTIFILGLVFAIYGIWTNNPDMSFYITIVGFFLSFIALFLGEKLLHQ